MNINHCSPKETLGLRSRKRHTRHRCGKQAERAMADLLPARAATTALRVRSVPQSKPVHPKSSPPRLRVQTMTQSTWVREAGRTNYGRPAPCTLGNHCLTCTIGVTIQTCTSKRLMSIHRQIHRKREVQNSRCNASKHTAGPPSSSYSVAQMLSTSWTTKYVEA